MKKAKYYILHGKNIFSSAEKNELWPHPYECWNFLYFLYVHPFPYPHKNLICKIMIYNITNRNIVTQELDDPVTSKKQYNNKIHNVIHGGHRDTSRSAFLCVFSFEM